MSIRCRALLAVAIAACAKDKPLADRDGAAVADSLPAAAPVVVTGDTLRGTLELAGTDSLAPVTLRTAAGVTTLLGDQVSALRRIIGLEVVVQGTAAPPSSYRVQQFLVRAALGEPAVDGILDVENGVFFLRTGDRGRVDINEIPPPLRGEIGSRVYVVGSLNKLPSAFGVISER